MSLQLHHLGPHHQPEAPRVRSHILPNIPSLRYNPEIVELTRTIYARAQEVLDRAQPLAHTRFSDNGVGPFSAMQFAFKDGKNRHKIQQSGLIAHDKQEYWDRIRVTSCIDGDRWSLFSSHHKDPGSLLLTRNRHLDVTVEDARQIMAEMLRGLDSWLMSRNNGDFFTRNIFPILDRADGFVQGFSHRVSPPKD